MMTDQPSLEYDVFISYARADGRDEADRLYQEFDGAGLKAWRDERSIDPYQDFSGEIEIAIEKSQYVVVCLTPSLLAHYDDRTGKRKDSFVRREIIYAQGCEKPIIPLVFPDFPKGKVPTLINHLTWLDFDHFAEGFAKLMARLRKGEKYQARHSDDPYYDYLVALQKSIVRFLDSTVFTLLALHTAPTPDAVNAPPREVKARNLPMSFGGFDFAALPVKKTTVATVEEAVQNPPAIFNDFPAAFEHYGGRVLLLGEPGAGKTTTLMAYAREAVAARLENADFPLPLLARIMYWDAQQQPPLAKWLSTMSGLDFNDEILAGRTLLLLDGLDELGSELEDAKTKVPFDPRQRFIEVVNAVPSGNQVLVSCRIKDYGSIGEKVALKGAVTLQPLDDAQLTEYLHDEPALYAAIRADEGLREMSRTPLLLSILTYAYRGMGDKARQLENLKDSPGELRDKIWNAYIRRRYKHEKCKPNADLPFGLWKMVKILRFAAMVSTKEFVGNAFDNYDIERKIIDDTDAFIKQITSLHLITVEQHRYHFVHLLLRDYLALDSLKDAINSSIDLTTRLYAAQGLVNVSDSRRVDILIQNLNDPILIVRLAILDSLGQIGDSRAVSSIIRVLHFPYNEGLRWYINVILRFFIIILILMILLNILLELVQFSYRIELLIRCIMSLIILLFTCFIIIVGPAMRRRMTRSSAIRSLAQIATPEASAGIEEWKHKRKKGESG
ncbi:MAG: TIR domain-containing protein [Anaerolineae bacterium]|nr:TIR domain-containing protein [Anaerolineae bacterium]